MSELEQYPRLVGFVGLIWNTKQVGDKSRDCWSPQQKVEALAGMIMGIQGIKGHHPVIEELELLQKVALT